MVSWGEFERERPDLAAAGRALFYQWGVGLGFLATTTSQGAPRLHPICPSLTDETLYAFIIPSPKLNDLLRDARYALHSDLTAENEDAFYVTGQVRVVDDPARRATLEQAYLAERPDMDLRHLENQTAVEFLIERCLVTRTAGHGDLDPQHTVWRAS
ncbi:MAG TPA: pyridoxamine 5'-phosphate oxidase [Dehalococcoidia bacterium]|nr:pyridoxamine 5'-phosphate oxidase [Dehalococcoidia bacterium]